jgi:hypothetical protein
MNAIGVQFFSSVYILSVASRPTSLTQNVKSIVQFSPTLTVSCLCSGSEGYLGILRQLRNYIMLIALEVPRSTDVFMVFLSPLTTEILRYFTDNCRFLPSTYELKIIDFT